MPKGSLVSEISVSLLGFPKPTWGLIRGCVEPRDLDAHHGTSRLRLVDALVVSYGLPVHRNPQHVHFSLGNVAPAKRQERGAERFGRQGIDCGYRRAEVAQCHGLL